MSPSDVCTADRAAALIAHILTRFHEAHRAELPELVALAQAGAPALLLPLQELAAALERHMFKEEARLFPMMEQGGNSLIGHLMADLAAEHRQHEATVARLQALVAAGSPLPAALRQGLDKLLADLQAHVQFEDRQLFPLFAAG